VYPNTGFGKQCLDMIGNLAGDNDLHAIFNQAARQVLGGFDFRLIAEGVFPSLKAIRIIYNDDLQTMGKSFIQPGA